MKQHSAKTLQHESRHSLPTDEHNTNAWHQTIHLPSATTDEPVATRPNHVRCDVSSPVPRTPRRQRSVRRPSKSGTTDSGQTSNGNRRFGNETKSRCLRFFFPMLCARLLFSSTLRNTAACRHTRQWFPNLWEAERKRRGVSRVDQGVNNYQCPCFYLQTPRS